MKTVNEAELRTLLKTNGVEVSDGMNLAEVEELVLSCHTDDEAVEKLCEAYPGIDQAWLKQLIADSKAQTMAFASQKEDPTSEEMTDLEDDALEEVAGGSVGSWFKKNWPTVLTVVAVCGVAAAGYHAYRHANITQVVQDTPAAGAAGATAGATAAAAPAAGETAGAASTAAKAAGGAGSGIGLGAGMFGISVVSSLLSEL